MNVYATLNIDGSLYPTNNANVSFLTVCVERGVGREGGCRKSGRSEPIRKLKSIQGSSISGLGAIFYLAYTTGSFLYLDIDFSFNNLQIAGFSTVYSNNHALTIAKLDLAGGSIAGQGTNLQLTRSHHVHTCASLQHVTHSSSLGQVTAQNVTSNNYDRNIAGGSGVYLKGRNMTVTQVWDVRNLPAFCIPPSPFSHPSSSSFPFVSYDYVGDLSQGASIITASTCAVFMDCNANFLAGDSSSVSIQAGGMYLPQPSPSCSPSLPSPPRTSPFFLLSSYVCIGTWTANPNANSSACSVNFGVPLFATGSFNYPATPGAVLPPTVSSVFPFFIHIIHLPHFSPSLHHVLRLVLVQCYRWRPIFRIYHWYDLFLLLNFFILYSL